MSDLKQVGKQTWAWIILVLSGFGCTNATTSNLPVSSGGGLAATYLYVSPSGDDSKTGTQSEPIKTFGHAVELVRSLLKLGSNVPIHVVFGDGEYPLSTTVQFNPADSGTDLAPVSYEAATGAKPVFTGGVHISGFTPYSNGIWRVQLPTVVSEGWNFEQLFVNGKRATRARYPNQNDSSPEESYLYMKDKVSNSITTSFIANLTDVAPVISLTTPQFDQTVMVAYHSWETSRHWLLNINSSTGQVTVKNDCLWGFGTFEVHPRYYFENFLAALDQPGEWFLDRSDGYLYYKPYLYEDLSTAEVVAPKLSTFLQFNGNAVNDIWVENINFYGLIFYYGQFLTPPEGVVNTQAAVNVPAVIDVNGARNIIFNTIEVAHIGTNAVWFKSGSSHSSFLNSYLHDLGAGGVKVGQTPTVGPSNPQSSLSQPIESHITIDNNIIEGGGRIHQSAIGVWISHSGDNQITHNQIGDLYYSGISVGWRFGYTPSYAVRNVIEFNRIHDIGQYAMNDFGGIYTLGESPGTSIANNVITDVYAYHSDGQGIYLDEGSSSITVQNNLVQRTHHATFNIHYGRENVVKNNIFGFGKYGQIAGGRQELYRSFDFQNNIIIYDTPKLLQSYWLDGIDSGSKALSGWPHYRIHASKNLYFNTASLPVLFGFGTNLADWQSTGQEVGSIVADPKFLTLTDNTFTLDPSSPALSQGFALFDASKAGVYGSTKWTNLAKSLQSISHVVVANKSPPPATFFGGMYGFGVDSNGTGFSYPNPATGATSCPSGYTASQVFGTPSTDQPLYICTKAPVSGEKEVLNFGGVYSEYLSPYRSNANAIRPNPATGGASCPLGYTAQKMLGSPQTSAFPGGDHNLYICYRSGLASGESFYSFGGAYGSGGVTGYVNPITQAASCPAGYDVNPQMLNSSGEDYPLQVCARLRQ
ncbi:MAG: right-handed parallel beta-helix repeat-containing protein [Bdellovibrionia bacterium]